MPTERVPGTRIGVCIIADDLSGALDAAGPFASRCGRFTAHWDRARAAEDPGAFVVLDTATREADVATAVARTREAVRSLWAGRSWLAFKKIDSVWRGNTAAEVAAASVEGRFERVIIAPAFPEQGRVTRGGGQWIAEGDGWRCAVPDIAAELRRFGIDAVAEAKASKATRAILCDAIEPQDLDAIVARHRTPSARTLWCGTGGLARALAARLASEAGTAAGAAEPIGMHAPVLVVVGTDHPTSTGQARELERQQGVNCRTVDCATGLVQVSGAARELATAVLLRFEIPPGTTRSDAQRLIRHSLARETKRLSPPGLVVATGGETLRAMSDALGATRLDVLAEREPGIPIGTWTDGRWAGTPVLSKSGGFGSQDLFVRVVAAASTPPHLTRNAR